MYLFPSFKTGYSHNQTVGRLPFTAAVIAVVTAVLYLLEFVVRQTSQVLESHERLKWLVLLVETLAHAFTGAVFWLVASLELPEPKSYRLMIVSTCLASLGAIVVDIDHFIAAGSLSIKVSTVCIIIKSIITRLTDYISFDIRT